MTQIHALWCIFLVLAAAVAFTGCTTQQAAPATPVPSVSAPAESAPATPAITAAPAAEKTEKTAEVTKEEIKKTSEKVILNTKGLISPGEHKTFDFKSMGDEFSKIGEKYTITLKSDKPVIGYAVTTTQADELQGNEMTPSYDSSSDKIQWGLTTPYMSFGRVTDSTKTFTVETEHQYVYVIDARWMKNDNDYKDLPAFNYELVIAKTPAAIGTLVQS